MTKSSLCTYVNITGNKSKGRGGNKVCKVTPHYMAAPWTGKRCADYFKETSRQASSNYCIGIDGDIAMSVDEDDRAWTSSSKWNDQRAVTIECANIDNSTGEMTAATWKSLVALCADICKRHGFRLDYTGDKNGSLTEHRMFSATSCPGAWLHARMGQLASEVNALLDGGKATAKPAESTPAASEGYMVRVKASELNVRDGAGVKYKVNAVVKKGEAFHIVEEKMNGSTKWGRLKSGAGWISLAYTEKVTAKAKATKSVDGVAREVIAGKWGNGSDRKARLTAAGYDYATVQKRVNQLCK